MQSDYTQIVKISCATRKAQFGATGGTSDMCSSHVNSVTNFHTGGSADSVQMLDWVWISRLSFKCSYWRLSWQAHESSLHQSGCFHNGPNSTMPETCSITLLVWKFTVRKIWSTRRTLIPQPSFLRVAICSDHRGWCLSSRWTSGQRRSLKAVKQADALHLCREMLRHVSILAGSLRDSMNIHSSTGESYYTLALALFRC